MNALLVAVGLGYYGGRETDDLLVVVYSFFICSLLYFIARCVVFSLSLLEIYDPVGIVRLSEKRYG